MLFTTPKLSLSTLILSDRIETLYLCSKDYLKAFPAKIVVLSGTSCYMGGRYRAGGWFISGFKNQPVFWQKKQKV